MLKSLHTPADFLLSWPFSENMNDNTQKRFSTHGQWLGENIVKRLCFLFLNHNDNRNYPNDPDQKFTYPGDCGLITCAEVDSNGFEWLLKVTILTCDLFACYQCVCIKAE